MAVHTYLTAMSPIEWRADDPDGILAGVREALRTHQQLASPLRLCPMVHMLRLQVIDAARPPMGAQDPPPLQSSYLLLAAELDGSVDDFCDCLYRVGPEFVMSLWGRCVGYGPYEGPVFFRRYIERCTLKGELPYAAFDVSVAQTLEVLALKERFGCWVADTKDLDPATLQRRWLERGRSLDHVKPLEPGTF